MPLSRTKTDIPGKPEGRPGIWLITPDTATNLIDEAEGETIHNFLGQGPVQIGADWSKARAREFVLKGDKKLALIFAPNIVMRHHLVAINDQQRWSFDIGEIAESRMQESEQCR